MAPLACSCTTRAPRSRQRVAVTVYMGSWPWSIARVPAPRAAAVPRRPPARAAAGAWPPGSPWSSARPSSSRWFPATEPLADGLPSGYLGFTLSEPLAWLWTATEVGAARRARALGRQPGRALPAGRRGTSAASCCGSCWRASSSSLPCCPGRSSPARRSRYSSRSRSCPPRSRSPCCGTSCSTSGWCWPVRSRGCCSPWLRSRRTSRWSRSSTSRCRGPSATRPSPPSRWRSCSRRCCRGCSARSSGGCTATGATRLGWPVGSASTWLPVTSAACRASWASLRSALRLPWVAVSDDNGLLADDGEPPESVGLPLSYAGSRVGELEIGLRPRRAGSVAGGRERAEPGGGAPGRRRRGAAAVRRPPGLARPARPRPGGGAAPVAPRPARRTRAGADGRGAHRRRCDELSRQRPGAQPRAAGRTARRTSARPSPTSAVSSTTCARRRWTRWGWSVPSSNVPTSCS